jgi:hypothetical protein
MSIENALWGAPHIHGELLKLGFAVAQSTVAKYMTQRPDPSSQDWGTFLRNHAPNIAAMDLFVVPTIGFDLLYVLVIIRRSAETLSGSTSPGMWCSAPSFFFPRRSCAADGPRPLCTSRDFGRPFSVHLKVIIQTNSDAERPTAWLGW